MSDTDRLDARAILTGLVGQEIKTFTGRTNKILELRGEDVIVATDRSPRGQPVPIVDVQAALDMLARDGQLAIGVETVGYRSAFVGAVLLTLPGVERAGGTRAVRMQP